jgi:cytochrome P450
LTIDIIAQTTLNVELNTQRTPSLPARLFGELNKLESLLQNPIDIHNFNPYLQWRRYKAWKDTNRWLRDQINSHLANTEQNAKAADIMDLAIQEFGKTLPLEDYVQSAGAFVFAGHDTISTTLSWLFYTLTQHSNVLRKLKQEHERVFGPDGRDTKGIYTQIVENPTKLSELKYTMQCIKEILRLYPPGATARMCQDKGYESRSKYF